MSEEQLKAFLEAVKADHGLQEKLNGANPDAVVAIAKELGFGIAVDDLKQAQVEISDKELERVYGGEGNVFSVGTICWLGCMVAPHRPHKGEQF